MKSKIVVKIAWALKHESISKYDVDDEIKNSISVLT